ncbi:hypothetical protein [Amycolatopsis granulosa]|uniref:hypothetical protein n=1 Tax=Amycolatopsis granulosa TaxID=185684 RepID=UPI00312CABEC|nr:hypothetical protein [Amycolatopsis granulosa]
MAVTGWRRVVLLCLLALGLVGMHHIAGAAAPESPAMSVPADAGHPVGHQDHGMRHDVLHLCLAVLLAGVVLGLGMLLRAIRTPPPSRRPAGCPRSRAPGRPSGRAMLDHTCVLRL